MSAFLLAVIFVTNSCVGLGVCENTAEKEVGSPNGKFKIVLYNRGCGATVGFLTGISILPSEQKLNDDDKPNVALIEYAVRDYWKDDSQKLTKGKMNFGAEWINDDKVVIYYSDSKFLTKREKFENIEIKYSSIR